MEQAPNDEQYAQAMEELKKAGEVIMSEVKKIATRESYGNALVELGKEHDNLGCSGRRPGCC